MPAVPGLVGPAGHSPALSRSTPAAPGPEPHGGAGAPDGRDEDRVCRPFAREGAGGRRETAKYMSRLTEAKRR